MFAYIVRKLFLTVWIMLGILVLTFLLFNVIARDPARVIGGKVKSPEQLAAIRHEIGWDKPAWFNVSAMRQEGFTHVFDSRFFRLLTFQFGDSYWYKEPVMALIWRKAPVSLAVQAPAFVIELAIQLVLALYTASRRGKPSDYTITLLAVLGMSVPALSIYLGAQWFFAGYLRWFPVAGWDNSFLMAVHFAALPILVTVIGGIGGGTRFYRTIVLEEISADYIRTARAKGVSESEVLLTHVFRNVLIPVVTNTLIVLPVLITGALLLERLFQIPGMGGLLVEAITTQDAPVVMAVVYITSLLYCVLLFLTDIVYTWVDPRVTLP